ncbi:iron ABC transporter permease [Cutibacterium sp.]|uniref:FecCD family ABC transporter permease n=1 Tax=Cutibacterium sp. TaxID=1912221 RepID=UPI0026DABDE6|nr:iron ABC transporter permease [Cutibacterium sp.]MDO4412624.1 iron ABC transporter permease [Cutibacterium sp.]
MTTRQRTVQRRRGLPLPVRFAFLIVVLILVAIAGLALGSVNIPIGDVMATITGNTTVDPVSETIIQDVRAPRTITALLVGAALGIAGLEMQTLFRNPLADPYVLGISSGSSLGVALVVLGTASSTGAATFASGLGIGPDLLVMVAAALGAAVVLFIVMLAGRFIHSSTILLLLGVMIGYFVSSGVTVLLSRASPELVAQYTSWQFGSYHGVTWENLKVMVPIMVVMILASMLLAKPLNALLLGERYAQTMGMNLKAVRSLLVASTAILAGAATAFCGPISFLGIAIPHLTRGVLGTADHRYLLPGCILTGGSLALMADILAQLPGDDVLPVNAVNAVFGAPVVMVILIRWYRDAEAT